MAKAARILGAISLFCAGPLALFALNTVGWGGLVDCVWGIVVLLTVLGIFAFIYANALDGADHEFAIGLGLEATTEEKTGLINQNPRDSRLGK